MLDEGFLGSLNFLREIVHVFLPMETVSRKTGCQVRVRTVAMPHLIGPLGANRDFDPFNSVHDKKPKRSVKRIKTKNVFEPDASLKLVLTVIFLERQPVSA